MTAVTGCSAWRSTWSEPASGSGSRTSWRRRSSRCPTAASVRARGCCSPREEPSTATRSARGTTDTRWPRARATPTCPRTCWRCRRSTTSSSASSGFGRRRSPTASRRDRTSSGSPVRAGWARCLRGQRFDDVCERFRASSHGAVHLVDSPEPVMGLRLSWRGEMDQARATTTRFLALADERGEAVSYTWLRLNLCGAGAARRPLGRSRTAARRVGGVQRPDAAEHAGVPVQPRPAGGRPRAFRRGGTLGDARPGGRRSARLPVACARGATGARNRRAAGARSGPRGRHAASGLGAHGARGNRRARRVPGRRRPGRGAGGAR